MNKLLEYGRTAMFYIRVLSGYEERRIRNYRMQLEQRVREVLHLILLNYLHYWVSFSYPLETIGVLLAFRRDLGISFEWGLFANCKSQEVSLILKIK